MTHDDESVVDKAKDAIGLDDDDNTDSDERPGGWAGVDDALGGADRPAGSIYGAEDDEDDLGETRREHQP